MSLPFNLPEEITQLWIIEAPGKRHILSQSLKELGIEGAYVFATKGYLMSMPESMLDSGMDKDFHDYARRPHNQDIYDSLLEISELAETIVVATDSDREGDVIAYDIACAVEDINPSIIRVRLQAMDAFSVSNAMEDAKDVEKADAVGGRTRALIDRAIGSAFLQYDKMGVGRVSAGLIGIAKEGGLSQGKLTLTAKDTNGGRPFSCELEIRSPLRMEMAERLEGEKWPELSMLRSAPYHFTPDDAGEVMLQANKTLGLTPKEAAAAMQRNYESGKMSYPRSHSKGFSRTVASKLKSDFNSVKGVTANAIPALKSSETHEALHAIGPVNLSADPSHLGVDEGVRTMVGRNVIKCLQSHVREYADTRPIVKYMKENDYPAEIIKLVGESEWYRDVGPGYPGKVSRKKQGIDIHTKEYMLLEACVHFGLGRSSSWPGMIESLIEKDMIGNDGGLTNAGVDYVSKVPAELLDHRLAVKIDNICDNAGKILEGNPPPEGKEPWEYLASEVTKRLPGGLGAKVSAILTDSSPEQSNEMENDDVENDAGNNEINR